MFNALDSNRNGMLSRKEFMKAFVILGFSLDTKEVDKLFAALDKNGDGCIDYAEMFSGVSSGKDMRKAAVSRFKQVHRLVSASSDCLNLIDALIVPRCTPATRL